MIKMSSVETKERTVSNLQNQGEITQLASQKVRDQTEKSTTVGSSVGKIEHAEGQTFNSSHQSSANGNFSQPSVSSSPKFRQEPVQEKVANKNHNLASSDNDLDSFPELLSGEVDPEKFLLSHGVDIFNNETHRQEFIAFCERLLSQQW